MSSPTAPRSSLYVPGDQPALFAKAVRSGTDAIIVDLEDAVGPSRKSVARTAAAEWVHRDKASDAPLDFVRVNSDPSLASADIAAVVGPGLDGIVLPKIDSVVQVRRVDHILSHEEYRRDLAQGAVALMVIIESAAAVLDCRRIVAAAPRVQFAVGGAAAGGDLQRSVGYEWTSSGEGRLGINSAVVLGARAEAVQPLYCGWMGVGNLDGLRADSTRARELGYAGAVVIHPSHVEIVNELFTPSAVQVQELTDLVAAFEAAAARGLGVIQHAGMMVDVAMARTARRTLARLKPRGG